MVTIIKACITNPLTGKLFGEVEADKNTSNKNFIYWHRSRWYEVKIDPDCLWIYFPWSYNAFGTKKKQIYIFEDFLQIKTWQKYASKWFPIKFITAWLLRTATFFKDSTISIQWYVTQLVLTPRKQNNWKQCKNYKRMAKTVDWSKKKSLPPYDSF